MRFPPPARRAALFLLALALPSAGVVALGLRSVSQERELAERRAAEDMRREVRRLHDDLFAALERLKLDAVSGRAASSPPLVFALTTRSGRLEFPWEVVPHAAASQRSSPQAKFARVVTSAERAEAPCSWGAPASPAPTRSCWAPVFRTPRFVSPPVRTPRGRSGGRRRASSWRPWASCSP
jgi:hypothetical protein